MNDERYILIDGQKSGPFSLQQLCRMAERQEIGNGTYYWSIIYEGWMPLAGILSDFGPSGFSQMLEQGFITKAEVLSAKDDCPACRALSGREYSVSNLPKIPPDGCQCIPWCGCVFVAVEVSD